MVGAEYFSPVFAQLLVFIYTHPQNNLYLKTKTTHVRAPLRANPPNNAMVEIWMKDIRKTMRWLYP